MAQNSLRHREGFGDEVQLSVRVRLNVRVALIALVVMIAFIGSVGCASSSVQRADTYGRRGFFDRFPASENAGAVASGRAKTYPAIEEEGDPGSLAKVIPPKGLKSQVKTISFQWPMDRIALSSQFGPRGRDFHEGIDIRAKIGTPVSAAQAGKVIYTGEGISGYGKMVVIRHTLGFATVYAHMSKILVKPGQQVKLGQRIALSGNTGRSSGPHLHFEVRKGVAALDPLRVLPRSSVLAQSSRAGANAKMQARLRAPAQGPLQGGRARWVRN